MKILIFIILLAFSKFCYADEMNKDFKNKTKEDYIPFIVPNPTGRNFDSNTYSLPPALLSNKNLNTPIIKDVPTEEIISLLNKINKTICKSLGKADIRVWVTLDANGKILGVGLDGQSGLEITFHCQ